MVTFLSLIIFINDDIKSYIFVFIESVNLLIFMALYWIEPNNIKFFTVSFMTKTLL